jgi:hypothetical protein
MGLPVVIFGVLFVVYFILYIFRKNIVLAYTGPAPVRWTALQLFHSFLTALLITLYLVHPSIARDVLQSLKCEPVRGTGTSFVASDMRVDCESPTYQIYRALAALYIVCYVIGAIVFVGWRIRVNRDALIMARMIYTLDSPIYVYFVRGYSQSQYLWEGAVLARKLGIVLCGVIFSSGLQLLVGSMIILASLVYTILKNPYQRTAARRIDPNRLDTYALSALYLTTMLGLSSYFVNRDVDLLLFLLLLLFNGSVVLILLSATVSRLKEPLQKALSVIANTLHFREAQKFEGVEMRRRTSNAAMTGITILPVSVMAANMTNADDDDPAMPEPAQRSRRGRITSETESSEDTWPRPAGGGVGSGLPEYKGTPRPTHDDLPVAQGLPLSASGNTLASNDSSSSRRSGRPSPLMIPPLSTHSDDGAAL